MDAKRQRAWEAYDAARCAANHAKPNSAERWRHLEAEDAAYKEYRALEAAKQGPER
jgi:hypothetical protein